MDSTTIPVGRNLYLNRQPHTLTVASDSTFSEQNLVFDPLYPGFQFSQHRHDTLVTARLVQHDVFPRSCIDATPKQPQYSPLYERLVSQEKHQLFEPIVHSVLPGSTQARPVCSYWLFP